MSLSRARLFFLLLVLALLGQAMGPSLHPLRTAVGTQGAAVEVCSVSGKISSIALPLGKSAPGPHFTDHCPCCIGAAHAAPPLALATLGLPRSAATTATPSFSPRPAWPSWPSARPRAPPSIAV